MKSEQIVVLHIIIHCHLYKIPLNNIKFVLESYMLTYFMQNYVENNKSIITTIK